jgi:prevent-host-death family protein
MAEVVGSSPTSSTSSEGPITIGPNPFRDRLGYWMDRVAAGQEVVITRHGRPRIRLSPALPPLEVGSHPFDAPPAAIPP